MAQRFEQDIVDLSSKIGPEENFIRYVERDPPSISLPRRILLYVKAEPELTHTSLDDVSLEPQEEGGFVAFSKEYAGAVGQGETVEEAIKDLQEAIQLLKEVLEEDTANK